MIVFLVLAHGGDFLRHLEKLKRYIKNYNYFSIALELEIKILKILTYIQGPGS